MQADDETIDEIIERVTVDAYGDEGYSSFAHAFEDEIDFPLDATLIDVNVEIRSVYFDGNERRVLVAVITRKRRDPPSFSPRPCNADRSGAPAHQRVPAMAQHQLRRPRQHQPRPPNQSAAMAGVTPFSVAAATTADLRVGPERVNCR